MQLTLGLTAVETWKPIPGWEGFYEVSDMGRVKSVNRTIERSDGTSQRIRERIVKLHTRSTGHLECMLRRPGYKKCVAVHRAVALAFMGEPPEGFMVCHNDGVPTNNVLSNLRYGTKSDNALDSVKHGTHNSASKTHCKYGHELSPENVRMRKTSRGGIFRDCIQCRKRRDRAYYYKSNGKELPEHLLIDALAN